MRWLVVSCCLLMLACLGTAQAWSVFVKPLQIEYGLTMSQTQLVFGTSVFAFSVWIIVAGRLQDRLGPRIMALAGACLAGAAYAIAYVWGTSYFFLWLGMGLIYGVACATAYTCPIATAIKWFPRHGGLVAGLATAAFASGPIIVQAMALPLLERGWRALDVLGLVGLIYTPLLILTALVLRVPPHTQQAEHAQAVSEFRFGALLKDSRVWLLFAGMLCGTFPYLLVMGNIRLLAEAWEVGAIISLGIPVLAAANAAGRIFWGFLLDRWGTLSAIRTAQAILIVGVAGLALAQGRSGLFLAAAAGIGFCYGSNFAIYPATVARMYGPHLLGSVYPVVIAAQGISSLGPVISGWLSDLTGSYMPGILLSAGVAVVGLVLSQALGRGAAFAAHHESAGARPAMACTATAGGELRQTADIS